MTMPASQAGPTSIANARDIAEARIESLNFDGCGVGRIDGKVVFVDGALPGETVRLAFARRRRHHDTARIVEVLVPSADRIAPPCPHYGLCGGCSLQHLAGPAQIHEKQTVLAGHLAHIGKVSPDTWLPPLSGHPFGYRRRARLGVRLVPKKGGVLVGFREKHSTYVTPLDRCLTLVPDVSKLLPALKTLVESLSCAKHLPQIEVASGDNMLALVFRHLIPLTDMDRQLLAEFGRLHQLQVWSQAGGPESALPLSPPHPDPLHYTLPESGVHFEFGPSDFIQVNADMNRRMVAQALDLLAPGPQDRVLDLFCGLGNFTLPIARLAAGVLGIEADARAVGLARHNAGLNNIGNAEFRVANLYEESVAMPAWADFVFNKLLLDPPRSGAIEAIKRLAAPMPERVVYVSCNPATLARDSQYLVQVLGYRLAAAGVMDMFPQTSHVESMALFTR